MSLALDSSNSHPDSHTADQEDQWELETLGLLTAEGTLVPATARSIPPDALNHGKLHDFV